MSENCGAGTGITTAGPGWLFCPADRPDRYLKALERADIVILDLEDAVSPARKGLARAALAKLARDGDFDQDRTVVRVNGAESPECALDLAVIADSGVEVVMVPKAETVEQCTLSGMEVIALVETPLGVVAAERLAAEAGIVGMMWGGDDFVAAMGGTKSRHPDGRLRDVVRTVRSRVLVAAKANGLLAIDGVHMDIADQEGLSAACRDAAAVGFDATAAIHPSQVDVIRLAYSPEPEEIDWAERLLAAVAATETSTAGVTVFEGRMVDEPIFRQARRVLQLARR